MASTSAWTVPRLQDCYFAPLTFCLPTCWLLSVYLHVGYILSVYLHVGYPLPLAMLVTSSPHSVYLHIGYILSPFCLPTCWTFTSSPLTFCLLMLDPVPSLLSTLHVGYITDHRLLLSVYLHFRGYILSRELICLTATCWSRSSPLTFCLPTCWLPPPPLLSVYLHVG